MSTIDLRNYVNQYGKPYIDQKIKKQIGIIQQDEFATVRDAYDPGNSKFKVQGTLNGMPPHNAFEVNTKFFNDKEIPNSQPRPWVYKIDLNVDNSRAYSSTFPRQSWIPTTIEEMANNVYKDGVPKNPTAADLLRLSTLTEQQKKDLEQSLINPEVKRTNSLLEELIRKTDVGGGGIGGGSIGGGSIGGGGIGGGDDGGGDIGGDVVKEWHTLIHDDFETAVGMVKEYIDGSDIKNIEDISKVKSELIEFLLDNRQLSINAEQELNMILDKLLYDKLDITEIGIANFTSIPTYSDIKNNKDALKQFKGALGYLKNVIESDNIEKRDIDDMLLQLARIKPPQKTDSYANWLAIRATLLAIKNDKELTNEFLERREYITSMPKFIQFMNFFDIPIS